jgi:hypothetical protein
MPDRNPTTGTPFQPFHPVSQNSHGSSLFLGAAREYFMIYRGLGVLAVLLFASFPLPFRQQVVSLSQASCVSPVESFDDSGGGRGGCGEEPNHIIPV